MRMTAKQARAFGVKAYGIAGIHGRSKSKYRNARVEYDGLKFDSKRERDYYMKLKYRVAARQIRGFARQVTIPLPSGKRSMRIDFMVVQNSGAITFEDAKGCVTKDWAVKRDELEHALGIRIETV